MNDSEKLKLDILEEMNYEPAVDASRIAVAVTDGVVTLRGLVATHRQARVAERAAQRVSGVTEVTNLIGVEPPARGIRDDRTMTEAVARALDWAASVPPGAVQATVRDGWVTLEGTVDWSYQRLSAEDAICDLQGVRGVSNEIRIRPAPAPSDIRAQIERAFRRAAEVDAQRLAVSVSGHRVRLRGTVQSWAEKEAAERIAGAAPGVSGVDNEIEVRAPRSDRRR